MFSAPPEQQFELLMREHGRQVFSYIFALVRNFENTEDLFQETSLALWERFDQFEPGTNFVLWACTVARYRVLGFFEREKRQPIPFSPQAHEQLLAVQSHLADHSEARREALAECVQKLSQRQRELLMQCYDRGRTVSEVAEELRRTRFSVYSSLRHVRARLLDCIRTTLARREAR